MLLLIAATALGMVSCSGDISDPDPELSGPVEVTIEEGPPSPTATSTATFAFGCNHPDGCDYECAINDGTFHSCSSPVDYGGFETGDHLFSVVAQSPRGEQSEPAVYQWTVDTDLPEVINLDGPSSWTNDTDATIYFECSKDNCHYECGLLTVQAGTGETIAPCESGVEFTDLEDGSYVFSVQPIDEHGNQGPERTLSWTVDTSVPTLDISKKPDEQLYRSTATVEFECTDSAYCTVECRLAQGSSDDVDDQWDFCPSPLELDNLQRGDYALDIRAVDPAGNEDAYTVEWTVVAYWTDVAAGLQHTCALGADGSLWCWGDGEYSTPTQIDDDTNWESLNSSHHSNMALREDGTLWAWHGADSTAEQVGDATDWVHINTSTHHCGIRDDDTLWCWGDNEAGQLGLGHTDDVSSPTQVGDGTDWQDVTTGAANTCALQHDGTLWCWGRDMFGALGLGGAGDQDQPQQLDPIVNWESLDSGGYRNCALSDDSTLWCWGDNYAGSLGLGDTDHRNTPRQVGYYDDWIYISVGWDHNCGVRDNDSLWCWGSNWRGQLGLDDQDNRHEPTLVDDEGWTQVASGRYHTCAIRSDATLWCWGYNRDHQVSEDNSNTITSPLRVLYDKQ